MTNHLFDALLADKLDNNRPFLKLVDGSNWSYAQTLALSGRLANSLQVLGVYPGDRVVVQVDKSPFAIALYFACLRAGAVFLPLNTAYTQTEMEYFISDSVPSVIVCSEVRHKELMPLAKKYGATQITLNHDGSGELPESARCESALFKTVARNTDDLAAILYTSGTTGRPKGAMLSHENLLSNAEVLKETWRFTSSDVLLHALPIFHIHGLFVATNVTISAGGAMILVPKFNADEIINLFPKSTVMMGVPTFYTRLLGQKKLNRNVTSGIRLFVSGSAPLDSDTHSKFQARTGHAILERYGMTETNMNASNPYEQERRAGSVGFPLPGIEIRICDLESGAELPRGDIGVIEVRGSNVFQGYWNKPGETASEMREDGFFITGDLGQFDEQGYLHIVGRAKDLIITGGYNVYPKEVEAQINVIDGVLESAVFGVQDPDYGEAVAAVVVISKDAVLSEQDIVNTLDGKLARFKHPGHLFLVDALPRNAMGKVLKNQLKQQYSGLLNSVV